MTISRLMVAGVAVFAAVAAWSGLADPAAGRDQTDGAPAWFAAMDADGDGAVSRQEALEASRAAKRFDRLDADRDGRLTVEEAGSGGESTHAQAVEKFRAADLDSDGALSREEVEGALPQLAGEFDALDHDQNGKLSSFEIHHPFLKDHGGMPGEHHGKFRRPSGANASTIRL